MKKPGIKTSLRHDLAQAKIDLKTGKYIQFSSLTEMKNELSKYYTKHNL